MTEAEKANKARADITSIAIAIITRMNLGDIKAIHSAEKVAWYAADNLGMSSQLQAQEVSKEIISEAIDNIPYSDIKNILTVIESTKL